MSGLLTFPVELIEQNIIQTFEVVPIPPPHTEVPLVYGLVFDGDDLLLVRPAHGSWTLPGGARRSGETFREALLRHTWVSGGVLLQNVRLMGVMRRETCSAAAETVDGTGEALHCQSVWLIAEARDVLPFSSEFEAEQRALVEPGVAASLVPEWGALFDAVVSYAQALRAPLQERIFA